MSGNEASWFKTGQEGLEDAKRRQEEMSKDYGPMRFFLRPGSQAKVTFLDTEGFYVMEHNLKIGGKWGNFFTCTKEIGEDPICDSGDKPSMICAYTIIDHSQYTSKKTGKVYQNTKKLLVVKSSVINKLGRKRENLEGDLTFGCFSFARDAKEECNTGEDIEFIKRLTKEDLAKLKPEGEESLEEWLTPFNYVEIFKPKSVEEMRAAVGACAPVGSDDYNGYGNSQNQNSSTRPPDAGSGKEESIDDLL